MLCFPLMWHFSLYSLVLILDDSVIFLSPFTQRGAMAISIPMVPYASNKGNGEKNHHCQQMTPSEFVSSPESSRILQSGRLGRNDAMRLRGRLQFASGQIFGRFFKRVCKLVSKFAGDAANPELDDESRLALKSHIETLTSSRPGRSSLGTFKCFSFH